MWNLKYLITRTCCWEDCDLSITNKCFKCHHYVCQRHSDEIFDYEEDYHSDSDMNGDISVNSLCWHCVDKHCNFECLRWF